MSATAQQRMKIANEKAMKNITNRGNVPKSNKENPEKYPVSRDTSYLSIQYLPKNVLNPLFLLYRLVRGY